jgi:hypothetical protein
MNDTGEAQLLAVASTRLFGFVQISEFVHFLFVAIRAKAMGKINIQMFFEIGLDQHPVVFVAPHFFAHGANGNEALKLHYLIDVFNH